MLKKILITILAILIILGGWAGFRFVVLKYFRGSTLAKEIRVEFPRPDEEIGNPVIIKGKAKGSWFFEGNAPVTLLDGNGQSLVNGYISTKDRWMTEEFVDFEGGFSYETPKTETGYLVFAKANPSGLTEYNLEITIPIRFSLEEKICEDKCGDGECQEIVCLGTECPCAETPESCLRDCGKK